MNDNTLYSEKESFNQQGYPDFYLKPNVINIGFRLFIALLAGSIPGFILIATLKLELFYLLPIDAICGGILIYWMLSSEHYFVVTEGKLLKLRMIDDKVIDELKMNEIKSIFVTFNSYRSPGNVFLNISNTNDKKGKFYLRFTFNENLANVLFSALLKFNPTIQIDRAKHPMKRGLVIIIRNHFSFKIKE